MIKGFSRLSKLILSLKKKILKISYKILAELIIFPSLPHSSPSPPSPLSKENPREKGGVLPGCTLYIPEDQA